MKSIIQELQLEATDPKASVSDLLRKAKIVAVKLDIEEFLVWIESELNGYPLTKTWEELPQYRIIKCEPKAFNPFHGWQPILFGNPEVAETLSKRAIYQPIGEIDNIIKNSSADPLAVSYSAEAKRQLIKSIGHDTDVQCVVSRGEVYGILEAVRNRILDWTLKLEKAGILGEGMTFSKEDKEKAKLNPTIYNIQSFAGTIGNVSDGATVSIQQFNNVPKEEIEKIAGQINKYYRAIELPKEEESEVEKLAEDLSLELKKEELKLPRIKSLLSSIRTILEGATGNVIAQGVIVAITKLIGV